MKPTIPHHPAAGPVFSRPGRKKEKLPPPASGDYNPKSSDYDRLIPSTHAVPEGNPPMNALVTPTRPGRWYTPEGTPCLTVPAARGGERDPTLRDARKRGLFPSVTGILDLISRPGLNAWIISQGILSSLTLPRLSGETEDAFAARIVKDMDAQRDNAALLGRRIHHALNQVLTNFLPEPEITPYLAGAAQWFDAVGLQPLLVEADLVSPDWGFGGRIDLYAKIEGRPALVDFKSQQVKKGKPNFYENWPLQLAAYRQLVRESGRTVDACYTVVIDSHPGQPVHVREWAAEELDFEAFAATFALWKYLKGYDPLAPAPPD